MIYAYFDGNEWVNVTVPQIRGLATNGVITPETMIRFPDGKEALARRISGLVFSEAASVPVPVPVPVPKANNTTFATSKKMIIITSCTIACFVVLIIISSFFMSRKRNTNDTITVTNETKKTIGYVKDAESDDPLFQIQQEYHHVYIPKDYSHQDYRGLFRVTYDGNTPREGFFEIDGKLVELIIQPIPPNMVEVTTGPLGARWTFLKPGQAEFEIAIGDKKKYRTIEVIEFPYPIGTDVKEIIRNEGYPDVEKSARITSNILFGDGFFESATSKDVFRKHWKYKKFPGLTIAVIQGEMIKITTEGESDKDSEND